MTTVELNEKAAAKPVGERELSEPAESITGQIFLDRFPKPTTDALDPLNFSRARKWTCLAIVMTSYFLFTFITTVTVPSFAMLQKQYNISYAEAAWTVAIPALGLAVGPLIWSPLADTYGRRIVYIVGTTLALAATIWSALAKNYSSYMGARFVQGLGIAPASTVGLAIINDLFFEHERGQKVGLWVLAIDIGLLVGPLVGGFVVLKSHYWIAWLCAILFGVLLVLEIAFLPETLYPRNLMLTRCPADAGSPIAPFAGSEKHKDIRRTKTLPFFNLKKIPAVRVPKLWDASVQTFKLFAFPNVSIPGFFYSFAMYWWIICVITYHPVAYAEYKVEIQGLLFGGMIIGTIIAELLFSGTLSDMIMNQRARKNHGIRRPEDRLWLFYPAITITAVGLIAWGVSVEKKMHWMVGQVALALLGAGIQMGNTACSAYIIDSYPMHAMSVVTFYAVLLNMSAFVSPFFIASWCDTYGFAWSFGVQGALVFGVMAPVMVLLQVFGARIRTWRGDPSWISPEYSTEY